MKRNYLLLMLLFVLTTMFKSSNVFAADPDKALYDAAMASIKEGKYYLVTEVGETKWYITQNGYLTDDRTKAHLFGISKVSGGALYDVGILIEPETGCHFSNTTLTDDSKANLHLGLFRQDCGNSRNDWERQVFYLKDGYFAIRTCNTEFGESSWADAGRVFWTYDIAETEYGLSYPVPCYGYEAAYVWMLEPSNLIFFTDTNVKNICISNWDTDGDGELSYEEAAAVTDLGTVFNGNWDITSFKELRYFTGLNKIGREAFCQSKNLASVTFPHSLTDIEDFAFDRCGLTSLTIPSSVTRIEDGSFRYNPNLTSIVVESGNARYDSRNNCNAIIETSTNKLLVGCKNTILQSSITCICDFAFEGCSLSTITIPSSVTDLCARAFTGNPTLTSIVVASGNPKYDSRNNCKAIIETSTNRLIVGCKNTVIPNTVKIIGEGAFVSQGLFSIKIPEGVTTIEDYAFRWSGLSSVAIPSTVITLGDKAFCECDLAIVKVLSAQPLPITENTFSSRANATLYVPAGSKAAYEAADYWKEFEEIIEYNYISVNNIPIAAGESKNYEFGLINKDANLVGFQLDLTLPKGVGIDKTGCKLSSRITDEEQELTIGKLENGDYRITSTSLSLTPIRGNDGTLFTLRLTAEDGCLGGHATISNIIFSTSESQKIEMSDKGFDISVLYKVIYRVDDEVCQIDEFVYNTVPVLTDGEPTKDGYTFGGWSALPEVMPNHNVEITGRFYLFGDVNTDEDVDVVDVVDIARFVVATPSMKFREKLADLNKDNTVNIADAVTLVNHIAGDQNFVKAMILPELSYNYGQCQLQLLSSGQNALSLCLDGEVDFTALQFDVDLPEGADISAIRINSMRNNGHQLLYNKVGENHYRVTALSLSNTVFKGSEGELLQISTDGQNTEDICVHDIHFVTMNGTNFSFDKLYISGNATGVANVNANDNNDVIYDLQGRKLSKVQRGVNIINGKKVIIR